MNTASTPQALPNDIDALKALVMQSQVQLAQKDQHIQTLSKEVSYLSEMVAFLKVRQYYKRSEKHPNQAELFNEAEVESEAEGLSTALKEEHTTASTEDKANTNTPLKQSSGANHCLNPCHGNGWNTP